jgi:hypothetical protein
MKIDSSNCTGSGQIGHPKNNYGKIGFSPCGEYVSHQSDTPCKDLVFDSSEIDFTIIHNCQCRTCFCDCGDFVSHKISEPCNAI